MAQAASHDPAIGTPLPAFRLDDVVSRKSVDSQAFAPNRAVLVMFICNHCPFVVHIRKELVKVAHEALDASIDVIAINSNSVQTHPQDGPAHMNALAVEESFRFPFLFDESQSVAKAFSAACTPDLYLFDRNHKLYYHGQFDDSRPSNVVPVSGADLRAAISACISGAAFVGQQKPCVGCSIKWKPA